MPRRPRVESAGFHHLINRGVARMNIFLKQQDYEVFLDILSQSIERYDFIVHSLCLMSNHYHLLLQTKSENISLIARQINSKYAQYFNREYKRVGPLWQGRFKNYFVYDEKYLYILLRFIERNPIKANVAEQIGDYPWCSSALLLANKYNDFLKESMLYDKDIYQTLYDDLDEDEMEQLNRLQKTTYVINENENGLKREKQNSLESYFADINNVKHRNEKIRLAILDGYKQSEVANYLGLSKTTVSKSMR